MHAPRTTRSKLTAAARALAGGVRADELGDRSAALTYYAVLSIVPGLIVLFALIGLLGSQATVDQVRSIVEDLGPPASGRAVQQPLERLVERDAQAGALLGLGTLGIVWAASAYVGCFFRASAGIWGVERRPARRAWPLRVAVTVVLLVLLALAVSMIVLTGRIVDSIGGAFGIGEQALALYDVLRWPALLAVVALAVSILYRASPGRERAATGLRVLTPGGALAVAAWLVASAAFNVYVSLFGSYESAYGALGAVIAWLVWLWVSNLALLAGVELDALIERDGA